MLNVKCVDLLEQFSTGLSIGISIKRGLKFLLAFFFISCCLSAGADQETIRLATEEYPPYTSKHLANYGLASHIVTDAFALEGVQTEYSFFPCARALLLKMAVGMGHLYGPKRRID